MKKRTTSKTSKFYNRVAHKGWHKSAYFTYNWKFPVMRQWLAGKLPARQKRVLSIGCGSGELERDLARLGFTVVGVDISHGMLKKAAGRGLKHLVEADACSLPFAAASFSAVVFPESIGYFKLQDVLPEVHRVLRQTGRLIIVTYPAGFDAAPGYKTPGLAAISRQLQIRGFRVADHRCLTVKRGAVIEVDSEKDSEVLYVMARFNHKGHEGKTSAQA